MEPLHFTGLIFAYTAKAVGFPEPDPMGFAQHDRQATLYDDNVAIMHILCTDVVLHTTTLN